MKRKELLLITALVLILVILSGCRQEPASSSTPASDSSAPAPQSASLPASSASQPAASVTQPQPQSAPHSDIVEPDGEFSTQLVAKTTAELNFRKGPGTQYESMLLIPQGGKVTEVGYLTDDHLWVYVDYSGGRGWVDSEWLALDDGETYPAIVQPDSAISDPTPLVATENLHLRCGPGTNYPIILLIPKDSGISEEGRMQGNNEWMYVDYSGRKGWVNVAWVTAK